MRDKIIYLVLGIIIASLSISIAKINTPNIEADDGEQIFESVTIKGKLTIGEGQNQIILQSKDDGCQVIVIAERSGVAIIANPDHASLLVSKELGDKNLIGILLNSLKTEGGNHDTIIRLKDGKGEKTIETR